MMKKRLIAMVLCTSLSVSLLAGCGAKKEQVDTSSDLVTTNDGSELAAGALTKEKITLNFVAPKAPLAPNYDEMLIFQRLEEETNVHIEWENIPETDYQTKKNLLLASGDLPDAFYNAGFSDLDIVRYGEDGTIIPLEDLIEEYAPNLKKILEKRPEIKQMITAPDGHIYSLPRAEEMGLITVPFFLSINKTWLDKLGLEVPKTTEEFYTALKAFKEQDPNGNGKADEVPFSFMSDGWCMDIADFFGSFGMPDNAEHKTVRDGKVVFTATHDAYKQGLEWFNQMYKEGLIDPESFTQDAQQYLAKGKTEDATLGAFVWWETEEVVGPDRADEYVLVGPLKGPNGDQIVGHSNSSEYGRAAFVITNANKNPEITMQWVDKLYEPKMSAQISWGPIDVIYEEDANGMLVNLPLPEGTTMGEYRQKVAPGGVSIVLKEDFGTVVDMEPRAKQRLNDIETVYAPYLEKQYYPMIFFTPAELEEINAKETDIKNYVKQMKAKWIVQGGIETEWDEYVQTLDKMGLQDLMKIWQDGLDRFNAAK